MKSVGFLPGEGPKLFVRYSKLSAIQGVRYREVLLYFFSEFKKLCSWIRMSYMDWQNYIHDIKKWPSIRVSDPFWKVSDPDRFPPDILSLLSDPYSALNFICTTRSVWSWTLNIKIYICAPYSHLSKDFFSLFIYLFSDKNSLRSGSN